MTCHCNCGHKCPGTCYLNRRIKGGSGNPIAPYAMNGGCGCMSGGSCSTCGLTGGSNAFVGSPWSATNWPGMDGIAGNRNYFEPYDTTKNPAYQMTMDNSG